MFCNTFYCPYAKYILKDIEAVCSLLSSADKSKKSSSDTMYNEKNFLQTLYGLFFSCRQVERQLHSIELFHLYSIQQWAKLDVSCSFCDYWNIFKSHLQKKYPYRLTFTLFLVAFISQDFLRAT